MVNEEKIPEALTDEWQSTHGLAKKTNINWYIIYLKLNEMANEDKIKKLKIGRNTYWKK